MIAPEDEIVRGEKGPNQDAANIRSRARVFETNLWEDAAGLQMQMQREGSADAGCIFISECISARQQIAMPCIDPGCVVTFPITPLQADEEPLAKLLDRDATNVSAPEISSLSLSVAKMRSDELRNGKNAVSFQIREIVSYANV